MGRMIAYGTNRKKKKKEMNGPRNLFGTGQKSRSTKRKERFSRTLGPIPRRPVKKKPKVLRRVISTIVLIR